MSQSLAKIGPNAPILLRHDNGGVATLTLNRGDKYNALSIDLMTAIEDQLADIAADPSVRVVVIAGSGKAFCAGHDLGEMMSDPDVDAITALFTQCSRMMTSLTQIPQLVIARVHGTASAAGCQLVAQCDLAVAASVAKFGTSGIKVGLFCSTPMVAVTRNLPRKQAMEMLMTGDLIDAEAARLGGLLNHVVKLDQLDQTIADLAARIIKNSPLAVARGKKLFYRQIDDSLIAAYARATKVIVANMQDEDARAGIEAFVNKLPMPTWKAC